MIKKLAYTLEHSFIKFAIVGSLGALTNLSIFYVFVDILHFWANVISVAAFIIAGIQNYILHHIWTFRKITYGNKMSFRNWVKFNVTTSFGLGINLIVLNLILYFYTVNQKVIAQACGVVCGMIFNYLGSKYFVFNKK